MSKLAVLTGATGGLGSVILAHLVEADYRVIAYGRNVDRLAALTEAHPRRIVPIPHDFCTTTPLVDFEIIRLPGLADAPSIDLLVCAHGAAPCTKPTLTVTQDDIATIYQTDVLGTFGMAQKIGASMIAHRKGAMVFLSSAHAYQTYPSRAGYAMSKAAICSLARALAVEWGPYGIRVNSISPWQCDGERSTAIAHEERQQSGIDTLELYRQRSPLRRLVAAGDVAKTVLWLAETPSVSGADITVDCAVGASMWHRGFEQEYH